MDTQFDREIPSADPLARALGYFSLALGAAELAAPAAMARLMGASHDTRTTSVVRAMGARELGHGIAILTRPGFAGPLWSRVAGDVADIGFLSSAYGADYANKRRVLAVGAAVLGVTVLDVLCARRLNHQRPRHMATTPAKASITINRPIDQVFAFWRRLDTLPQFMRYLESVERLPDGRSRWQARGPGGVPVSWDAETVAERDNELISWRSLPGGDMDSHGTVRFTPAPGARGTEVRVEMAYRPPAGTIGRSVAWLLGRDPSQQITEDLRRLKQLLEAGEIALSEGEGFSRPGRPTGRPEQIRTLAGVRP